MRDVVIASAVRTPIGSFGGSLKNTAARTLGAITIKKLSREQGSIRQLSMKLYTDVFSRADLDRTLQDRRL